VFDRQDSRAWGLDTSTGPDTGIVPGIGTSNLLVSLPTTALTSTPATPCSDAIFQRFTPGCTNYYLGTAATPKYGYYVPFPIATDVAHPNAAGTGFIAKGINPPIVVAGSMLYSYFAPTKSDPCTGGQGFTYSFLISDVMNPIVNDQRSGLFLPSGARDTWVGVASDYIAIGTSSVLQAGTVGVVNPAPGAATTTPEIHTTATQNSASAAKIRVWRTVQ
jgi:hypothetical protein